MKMRISRGNRDQHGNWGSVQGTGTNMGMSISGGIGHGSKDQNREWGSAIGMEITHESED